MRVLSAVTAACFASVLVAQSPFNVVPTSLVAGQFITFSGAGVFYYDLTVNTTITLQALEVGSFSQVGEEGSINFYMTDGLTPAMQTHVGNELDINNWTLMSSGPYTANGVIQLAQSCQTPGVVLQPGTYGIAIEYVDIFTEFVGVGSTPPISNAELTVSNGAVQTIPFDPAGALIGPFVFNGVNYAGARSRVNFIYSNGSVPHACSNAMNYGEGCYKRSASPYQLWTVAADASNALQGQSLTYIMNPAGDGYVLASPGIGTYVPPGTLGVPTNTLTLGDNDDVPVTTTQPILYPSETGLQASFNLFVHANGYISVDGSNDTLSGQNTIPAPGAFLDAPAAGWWSWHDFNPTEAGSGQVVWEENPATGTVYVTWDNVESNPPTTANPSTVQFQFDAGGNVTVIWQNIDPVGGSTQFGGDSTLIGFSPAGVSPDAGQFDIASVTGVSVEYPESEPLRVRASATPLIGTQIDIETLDVTGTSVGVLFFGVTSIFPGIDLGVIGMPGCDAYIDPNTAVGNLISNIAPGSTSVPLPIPNDPTLAALQFVAQSIWLDPAANAFGAISSDGLLLTLGSF